MAKLSDVLGVAGRPARVTRLTSGTGTYTPLMPNSLVIVTLQAAGGGGFNSSPGGGGEMRQFRLRISAPVTYVVPAAVPAAGSARGGDAVFGEYRAAGGGGGGGAGAGGNYGGGFPGLPATSVGGYSPSGAGATSSTDAGPGGGGTWGRPSGAGFIIIEEYGA